jgi:hypothetical protein
MFIAAELRDWLTAAGFSDVRFYDNRGEPLSSSSPRAIVVAAMPGAPD